MTDLQMLVRQTSNPSIINMQQRLHSEVVELGKLSLQWKERAEALQLALETEREAANRYASQVAHWIGKHDELLAQQLETGPHFPPQQCVNCIFYDCDLHQEPCSSCVQGGNVGDNFQRIKE